MKETNQMCNWTVGKESYSLEKKMVISQKCKKNLGTELFWEVGKLSPTPVCILHCWKDTNN